MQHIFKNVYYKNCYENAQIDCLMFFHPITTKHFFNHDKNFKIYLNYLKV